MSLMSKMAVYGLLVAGFVPCLASPPAMQSAAEAGPAGTDVTTLGRTVMMTVWLVEIGPQDGDAPSADLVERLSREAPAHKAGIEPFLRQIAYEGMLRNYRYAVLSGVTDTDTPVHVISSHEAPLSLGERAENVWQMVTTGTEIYPSTIDTGLQAVLRPGNHTLTYRIHAAWEQGAGSRTVVSADEEGGASLDEDQVLAVPLKGHPLDDNPCTVTFAFLMAEPLAAR